ncbi:unnamed protein product [Adineta steineri]|uniref:DUF962 domain-containing protein n=1 Tax=Adineta steineri TaxID=433720 RepID=A0A815LR01_9BILA|nr:unnamed protein product [Adineta steineri]
MSGIGISLLAPFFKGNSLESEFGFVNYYHSHRINRLLHTCAIPLLIFGILTMTYSIDYRLALFFYIFYCGIVFLFDSKTAISYMILFGILFNLTMNFSSQSTKSILYGFLIFFSGLIIQGFGHYKFQQSPPAFRLFEAIFTTPIFLMMYIITDHNKPFWNNVQKETNKWKQILNK